MTARIAAGLFALLLAGCASVPTNDAAVMLPDDARAHPEHYVVITVRNTPGVVNAYAASTPRGYGGQGSYRAGAEAVERAHEIAAVHHLREVAAWPIELLGVHCLVYEIPAQEKRDQVLAALRRDPGVESAEPLARFEVRGTTYNDPYAGLQRNLRDMGIAASQQRSQGDGVRVAVIDTGVDVTHPDFGGRIASGGDFVADGRQVAEAHGTAVAGIIAAVPNNGIGIAGIAPAARVLPLRACWSASGGAGECNSFTLAQALAAAMDAHASIVNLSLGGPSDPLLERIVERGMRRGIVFVGAVPASGQREGFPTGIEGVIAVDAAEHSTHAPRVLYAPGSDVFTLAPMARYDAASGSSVAAAEITAVAALLLARRPELNAREIEEMLGRSMTGGDVHARVAASVNACIALRDLLHTGECTGEDGAVARAR
ncbi:MAG: S8 family peptidase [Gemmatimonadota bacterium]